MRMAPDVRPGSVGNGNRGTAQNGNISSSQAARQAKMSRKRTKTGCLTCRKRRIKCGEERPVCRNCVKSKRHCEGYSQRVVFKQPTYDYRPVPHGGAHITFPAAPFPGHEPPYNSEYGPPVLDPSYYSHMQPRPVEQYGPAYQTYEQRPVGFEAYPANPAHNAQVPPGTADYLPQYTAPSVLDNQQPTSAPPMSYQQLPEHTPGMDQAVFAQAPSLPVDDAYMPPQTVTSSASPIQNSTDRQQLYPLPQEQQWSNISPTSATLEHISPTSSMSSRTMQWGQSNMNGNIASGWASETYVPRPELTRPIDYRPPPTSAHPEHSIDASTAHAIYSRRQSVQSIPEYYEHEGFAPTPYSSTYFLSQAAVETQDDNYYDVDSDEESELDTTALASLNHRRDDELRRILHVNGINVDALQTRRTAAFTYDGVLDHYRVEDAANPLRNLATVRVFVHFIYVTGPSLSPFERHGRHTSVLFNEGQVPISQQGLWTYAMPVAALRHPGLLHAMCALSSLHIARLQKASDTPSRQHYIWAVKRINRLLADPKKRYKITTIATSMLLGFYEILSAQHLQWNVHLTGSKQLFAETNFGYLARQFRQMKNERAARVHFGRTYGSTSPTYDPQDEQLDQIEDVNERLVSQLVGQPVRYDDRGWISPQSGVPPQLNLSNYEMLRDLYWWYLKQDAFQSIISGNPLILEYSRWADCPPRAPLGRPDAAYGSFDHLMLLLGRIADFASRDRKRKLRQMKANDGKWIPAPGMSMPGPPPQQQQSTPPTHSLTGNSQATTGTAMPPPPPQGAGPGHSTMPPFFGMAPPPRENVRMPSAYSLKGGNSSPPRSSAEDTMDLQSATQAAHEEYGNIRAALHTFSQNLGDAFKPLTSEYEPPLDTPFGTALFYRNNHIGVVWAVYYMAVIIAIRSHPSQHPASHAAAAIAAKETAFFANEIGRIAAGIRLGPRDQPLNPTLGSALCDSCMPSFFAAIQYTDAAQRHATVTRIYEIAHRTGWGSIEMIGNGCETAWIKAAALGRGPPYTRVTRMERSEDPRLNGTFETVDANATRDPNETDDQQLIKMKANARLTWAIGVYGVEGDDGKKADELSRSELSWRFKKSA